MVELKLRDFAQGVVQFHKKIGTPAYNKAVFINSFFKLLNSNIDINDMSELSHLTESDLDYCISLIREGNNQEQVATWINF